MIRKDGLDLVFVGLLFEGNMEQLLHFLCDGAVTGLWIKNFFGELWYGRPCNLAVQLILAPALLRWHHRCEAFKS